MTEVLSHWLDVPLGDMRAVIVLVHGLGEHSKRYDELVAWLVMQEYAVVGYDHYGHGKSAGKRGTLTAETQLRDDLQRMVEFATQQCQGVPVYLLGHSMGGLVALDYALADPHRIQGVLALSPALALRRAWLTRRLVQLTARVAPNATFGNGLNVDGISHRQDIVAAYRQDPLVHDHISPRLARYLWQAGERVRRAAPHWCVPTLLLYAGADRLVDPQGSAAFAAHAPEEMVTVHRFAEAYHELHHEPDTEAFYRLIHTWLRRQRTALSQKKRTETIRGALC